MFLPHHSSDSAAWALALPPPSSHQCCWKIKLNPFWKECFFWLGLDSSRECVLYPITVEKQMGGWGRDMCAVISQLAHSLLLEIHAPSGGTKNRRKLRWGKRTCWDYINLGMSRKVGSVLHEGHWPFQIILSSKKDRTLYSLPSSAFLMISFPNHCCLLLSLVLHP